MSALPAAWLDAPRGLTDREIRRWLERRPRVEVETRVQPYMRTDWSSDWSILVTVRVVRSREERPGVWCGVDQLVRSRREEYVAGPYPAALIESLLAECWTEARSAIDALDLDTGHRAFLLLQLPGGLHG